MFGLDQIHCIYILLGLISRTDLIKSAFGLKSNKIQIRQHSNLTEKGLVVHIVSTLLFSG